MISRVTVSDFQSLESVDLHLGKFTVVVGPSNSGKSAIRRAIEALVHNDPVTGRLRNGTKSMSVQIVADEVDYAWIKQAKGTRYFVGELEIAKPGANCPPAVIEGLRLYDINFASQFDQPYLLAETPSAAAKALGELTNIAQLFEAIREATRRQRAADQKARTLNEQALTVQQQLVEFETLPVEKAKLEEAHAVLEAAVAADRVASTLFHAGVVAWRHEETRAEAWAVVSKAQSFDDVAGMVDAAQAFLREAEGYERMAAQARGLFERVEGARLLLQPWEEPDLTAVQDALITARFLNEQVQEALGLESKAKDEKVRCSRLASEIATLEAELATIDVCPLCGSPTGVPVP